MSVDRAKILDKIKKCLALSKSANEHEAAAALRQAQTLMRLHEIDEAEIEDSKISEANASASAARRPASWETILAGSVADAFGCVRLFGPAASGKGSWCFVGAGCAPTIAQNAFTVLLRQVKGARKAYSDTALRRCTQSRKTVRADMFCLAWVTTVDAQVARFARQAKRPRYRLTSKSSTPPRRNSSFGTAPLTKRSMSTFFATSMRDSEPGRTCACNTEWRLTGLNSCSKTPIERQRIREHEQC
ncbi:DUF2786 domain-containing protein [Caballeronia sp. EK]|uniref:DUF2786 domain-containing protein n=1 Tax=Caballeronia sp. EK TaxID=2767469 RepID=UPI00165551AF|nr:DUF2786 domain-containing protein [Caballeronia sp. EK]